MIGLRVPAHLLTWFVLFALLRSVPAFAWHDGIQPWRWIPSLRPPFMLRRRRQRCSRVRRGAQQPLGTWRDRGTD